ncbi:hypothetical protein KR038_009373 [Drosophila bunnanda]|nr:hypothetical protein KR038_009373 [Drosophila bunnanda]
MNSNVDEKLNLEKVPETPEEKVNPEKAKETIEENLNSETPEEKVNPEKAKETIEENLNSEQVQKAVVEKPVAAESLDGAKEAPKKSTEKPRDTMLKNTTSEKEAQEADFESIAGTSKSKDASSSAKTANKDAAMTSKKTSTKLKRIRDRSESHADQKKENRRSKKRKANAEEESDDVKQLEIVKQMVANKLKKIPKPVYEPGFIETTRRTIHTMSRRELEDLAMRKTVEEKKAKCDAENIRKEWIDTENKLATYRSKVNDMLKLVCDLETVETKRVRPVPLIGATRGTSQNVVITARRHSRATGSMLPPASGNSSKAKPGPIPERHTPKCVTKVRPAVSVHTSSAGGNKVGTLGSKQNVAALPKPIEKAVVNVTNKIAGVEANPPKASTNVNPGQAATNTVEETAQVVRKGRISF